MSDKKLCAHISSGIDLTVGIDINFRNMTPSKDFAKKHGDRFIPCRMQLDRPIVAENHHACFSDLKGADTDMPKIRETFRKALSEVMFGNTPTKLMYFHPCNNDRDHTSKSVTPVRTPNRSPAVNKRTRPQDPYRTLDAPGLIDDFYLNLMAWSSVNIVAVALLSAVYLGNMTNDEVFCLYQVGAANYISSLEWIGVNFLAVGISNGKIQVFDVNSRTCVRDMTCHSKRVSSLNWSETNFLVSGGRDGIILHHDLRSRCPILSRAQGHLQEVCQVSWSLDGKMLASGGNDDIVRIWDVTNLSIPRFTFSDHKAAVKALAWNPHDYSMIVTGGGSNDKTIKFWNARVGGVKKSITTVAQVCSLQWNPHCQELLSGHGYGGSKLCLWGLPSVTCIQEFPLRSDVRPLNMALSPDGSQVCVANSDETLKFWEMFLPTPKKLGLDASFSKRSSESLGESLPLSDSFWENYQLR
jgi:cell division cycle 20, cofactor of APC complex